MNLINKKKRDEICDFPVVNKFKHVQIGDACHLPESLNKNSFDCLNTA